ncbi:hypothetical protein PoB_006069000 [Plakobranchus ocellatus]|uniref:Uncharacterized protein n=1 Tax=Plakobranchus ocellatus TaxID=259542 RepID=A0AAV4CQK4_9GAST|nr:hypothetical protein PoB_006069000 [Plakobranchus ocellatus]
MAARYRPTDLALLGGGQARAPGYSVPHLFPSVEDRRPISIHYYSKLVQSGRWAASEVSVWHNMVQPINGHQSPKCGKRGTFGHENRSLLPL